MTTPARPELVADPALVSKLCEQAVEIALLRHQLAEARRRPRAKDGSGRFISPIKAKAAQLREEQQAQANGPLADALEVQRLAAKHAPASLREQKKVRG